MRKPRDIDAELKALAEKARGLKAQRLTQLGELVTLTGADALDLETLAGGLLHVIDEAKVPGTREVMRKSGAAFFQRRARGRKGAGGAAGGDAPGAAPDGDGDAAG